MKNIIKYILPVAVILIVLGNGYAQDDISPERKKAIDSLKI